MMTRELNFLRHPITSRQALGRLLDFWSQDRSAPVILIAPKGEADNYTRRIRVALSKEKSLIPRNQRSSYGFTSSDPFPCRVEGKMGQAILVHWRLTPGQNMRNVMQDLLTRTPFPKVDSNAS